MTKLSVNINKIATLRNARGGNNPDVLKVAKDCEAFGADGITVHPRPDERHIRRADVPALQAILRTEFNIEGCPTKEFMDLVKDHPTMTVDVELKEYPNTPGNEKIAYDVCDRVMAMIDEYGYTDRVVINSFSNPLNEYVYKKFEGKYRQHVYYPICVMGGPQTLNPYDYAYCACMFKAFWSKLNMATAEEFAMMAARGPQPWAGACVSDAEGVDLAIANKATLITCNNPDEVLRLLRERGYHK